MPGQGRSTQGSIDPTRHGQIVAPEGHHSDQIGRLVIGRVHSTRLTDGEIESLGSGRTGGITLFKENASDLRQLIDLIHAVRKRSRFRPLISVDQEGGAVQRFDHVLSPLPSAMAMAASQDMELVRKVNHANVSQLSCLGVNCLLAPVLDVPANPVNPIIGTRAYGTEQNRLVQLAENLINEARENGIISVGKHFPGHGSTEEDSHTDLAVNKADADLLWRCELSPFRACIESLPSILTGHVWVPVVDEEPLPASLSPKVTTGILRQYLGFDGLVMTDDLTMGAITEKWGLGEAAVIAIEAGADMVLVCGSTAQTDEVHAALKDALESGRLTEERIEQSLARLDRVMNALPDNDAEPAETEKRLSGMIESDTRTALKLLVSSITQLRGNIPDLNSDEWLVLIPEHGRYPLRLVDHLKMELEDGSRLAERRYPLDPTDAEAQKLVGYAQGKNVLLLTFRAVLYRGQRDLATALAEMPGARVHCSTDSPYDILAMPKWDNCLTTYDPSDLAMQALAHVLSGKTSAKGQCPVSLKFNA